MDKPHIEPTTLFHDFLTGLSAQHGSAAYRIEQHRYYRIPWLGMLHRRRAYWMGLDFDGRILPLPAQVAERVAAMPQPRTRRAKAVQ